MRSRLFWRRTAAAVGTYASAALGFGATVVALHVFATGLLLALAPAANTLLHKHGLTTPLLIGAFIPLAQCTENVGGVAIVLRGRYDVRAFFLFVSMALRFTAIAVAAPHGLSTTIAAMVAAQAVATTAVSITGWIAYRRFPQQPGVPLGDDRRDILSFVAQSSVATAVISLTAPLSLLILGRVASTRQVAFFRAAMSPQQAFAVVSAPARLILLTEQTRDWERGTRDVVFAGIKRYMLGMTAAAAVILPPLLAFTPELAKLLFSAKNVGAVDATRIMILAGALRMIYGWTKSFPVSIGRPALRMWTHGLEMLVLVPLVAIFGEKWGATGAAGAVLISSVVFCLAWTLLFSRIQRGPGSAAAAGSP